MAEQILPADEILGRIRSGSDASEVCEALTELLDEQISRAASDALGPEGLAHFQLIAVGGYGRREIFPHADIDIVILYRDPLGDDLPAEPLARLERSAPGFGERIQRMLLQLQDSGLRLSARVRSVSEHLTLIGNDVTVATASLDSRLVAGSDQVMPEPSLTALATIRNSFAGGADGICALIEEGLHARHEQFGGSAFMLEPQLKMGRGGLRDGHAVRWAAQVRFGTCDLRSLARDGRIGATDAEAFEQAFAFIARVRLVLHALSRWRNDRLAFERQPDVARGMGFGTGTDADAVSELMRSLYKFATTLAELAERWLEEWTIAAEQATPERIAPGILRIGERLAHDPALPPSSLADVRRILQATVHQERPLHPATRTLIRELAAKLEPAAAMHPAAIAMLREAILTPTPDGRFLRLLLELDLLRTLVPEWAHLVGHTSRDVHHVYTTDRHLLESFLRIAGLDKEPPAAPRFVTEAWSHLGTREPWLREAIRLATLFHDVGKALEGDHSLIGAGMTAEIARRMELPAEAIELARWLVLEHLRLARVSQRRDLSDPRTIETFAGFIRPPGELHALAVLTWADATSVSPQGTLSWKIELLRGLYEATRHYLHGTPAPAPHLAERQPMQSALRDGSLSDDTLRWLTTELSDAHWAAFNDDELGTAVAMLAEAAAAPTLRGLRLDADGAAGSAVLWVCTKDRPRLLFDLTAGIAADRVNILRARIFTTKSGWIVDRFDLDWTDPGGKALSDRRSKRLLATMEDVLSGATNTATLRQKWQSESKAQPRHRQPIPLNVKRAHEPNVTDLVIVEVKCRDRIGLLADLSLALWDLGFEIDRSIISSEGERAVDTFYVRPNAGCTVAADDLAGVLKARMELTDGSHSQPG